MKILSLLVTIVLILFVGTVSAGTFVSGSTGADGAFYPTTNTVLQLPPNGIFNFTTVNIPAGVTVTFNKNAGNTPVYILTTGDVTISGTIDVSGQASNTRYPGSGGPGGFDGGTGGLPGLSNGVGGNGLGPGGGGGGVSPENYISMNAAGGSFGTSGSTLYVTAGQPGPTYGNARLIPLIGGSGGGGTEGDASSIFGGGGGGGAILIASSGQITINTGAYINALGGSGTGSYYIYAGGGSGGAIKLVANTISGNGYLSAYCTMFSSTQGGYGRIRLEAYNMNYTQATTPVYSYGLPGSIFLANTPSLRITSIAGVGISSNPTGSYTNPDVALPSTTTNPVTVTLSASYIPISATVTVSAIPQYGSATNVTATLSGTDASSIATTSVNLSTTYASVIMAYTTYTIQAAMYWEGEKIEKVRVASSMGSKSEAVYITESGKEIKAEKLILAGLLK